MPRTISVHSKNWLIVLGFNDTSTLVGHFVVSQKKGEEKIEGEMKERDWEERGTGMKGIKQKE